MKRLIKAKCLGIALSIGYATTGLAEGAFEGELAVISGLNHKRSNFNTENNRKPSPLDSEAESDTKPFILPLGQIRYNFGVDRKYSVFAGTSRDDIVAGALALKLGAGLRFGEGSSIELSVLPTIVDDETWENPYLVDQHREETEVTGNAFLLDYDNLLNSRVDLSLGYYHEDVDEELSGQGLVDSRSQQLLDRNGEGYFLGAGRRFAIGRRSFLEPAIYVQKFRADGDAMSFTRYSAGLTYGRQFDSSSIGLSFRLSDTGFKDQNPVFGEKQDSLAYKINLSYEYREMFGQENWSFISLAGYSETNSNITFFDENGAFGGVGVSYKF